MSRRKIRNIARRMRYWEGIMGFCVVIVAAAYCGTKLSIVPAIRRRWRYVQMEKWSRRLRKEGSVVHSEGQFGF